MLSHTPSDYIKANGLVRKLVGLLSDALVNVQREVEFFERVARQYGLAMDEGAEEGRAVREMKGVMGSVELLGGEGRDDPSPGEKGMLMVGLVLLYGTEIVSLYSLRYNIWSGLQDDQLTKMAFKCYLTAWRNALPDDGQVNYKNDADGGALRTEFIPNWTSAEFKAFVERIAVLTDEWWNVAFPSDEDKAEILPHVEIAWRRLLEVEAKFWPEVT